MPKTESECCRTCNLSLKLSSYVAHTATRPARSTSQSSYSTSQILHAVVLVTGFGRSRAPGYLAQDRSRTAHPGRQRRPQLGHEHVQARVLGGECADAFTLHCQEEQFFSPLHRGQLGHQVLRAGFAQRIHLHQGDQQVDVDLRGEGNLGRSQA